MTPAELAQDILDTHHAYLYEHMPALDRALTAPGVPDAVSQRWRELVAILEEHLQKEEEVLFPAILAGEAGDLAPVIEAMVGEHDQIRACERTLRGVADLVPDHAGPLLALLDDLGVHAGREDDELFPAVTRGDR